MRTEKAMPVLNAGSLADVAFLLLIFFLVTTTIQTDTGLPSTLPPWSEEVICGKTGKQFKVILNGRDRLLIQGQPGTVAEVDEALLRYVQDDIANPKKAVVSLETSASSSYDQYIQVHRAILATYKHLWEELAQRQQGRSYNDLLPEAQQRIRAAYPLVLAERQYDAVL